MLIASDDKNNTEALLESAWIVENVHLAKNATNLASLSFCERIRSRVVGRFQQQVIDVVQLKASKRSTESEQLTLTAHKGLSCCVSAKCRRFHQHLP
jgi:hypothetical protein